MAQGFSARVTRRALLGTTLATPAFAQAWAPSRTVTVLVPNPPGGGSDFAARLFTDGLSRMLGQTVVVENRPGANGNLAIQAAVRAAPDGHTLLLNYSGYHAGNPAMMENPGWDPLRDLSPIGMGTLAPHIILGAPNLPVSNLREFISLIRENPGKMNYGSSGHGSIQHIAGVLFSRAIGAEMVHVPYRGAAQVLQDVAGGRIEMFITTPSSAMGLIQGNRVKPLAMASAARATALPEVPTTAEAGMQNFTVDAWFAFFTPAGTPQPIRERYNAALRELAQDEAVKRRAEEGGAVVRAMTLPEMEALVRKEVEELGAVIRQAGIRLE
ncbi:Bug family tripartite tricarboxylate transporter substrate binding protein [Rhodovarius crocodyli]|nr:tripartite tricarboxylate transporter substrate binding protein [Rhodovarius crocodyli]